MSRVTRMMWRALRPSPTGLAVGLLADRVLGDPRRFHPVAGMGQGAAALEARLYADRRGAGVVQVAVCVGAAAGVGGLTAAVVSSHPGARILATAAATWAVCGGTTLAGVGGQMADALDAGDLEAGRALVPSLCGRDPQALDAAGICRAATESIAENTADATVGPLVWGAVAGLPGLLGYRMANTLDAMIGHHNRRYERFGWAAARFDDVLNLVPARLSGLLVVALGPDRRGALRAWRDDAAAHPSPNAGVVEASFAGALGVRLGGETVYPHRVEQRPVLGDGRPPGTADLRAAVALSRRVQLGALAVSAGVAALLSRRSAG